MASSRRRPRRPLCRPQLRPGRGRVRRNRRPPGAPDENRSSPAGAGQESRPATRRARCPLAFDAPRPPFFGMVPGGFGPQPEIIRRIGSPRNVAGCAARRSAMPGFHDLGGSRARWAMPSAPATFPRSSGRAAEQGRRCDGVRQSRHPARRGQPSRGRTAPGLSDRASRSAVGRRGLRDSRPNSFMMGRGGRDMVAGFWRQVGAGVIGDRGSRCSSPPFTNGAGAGRVGLWPRSRAAGWAVMPLPSNLGKADPADAGDRRRGGRVAPRRAVRRAALRAGAERLAGGPSTSPLRRIQNTCIMLPTNEAA